MFGLSGTEIAVILVLALLLLGPRKLPELARSLGRGLREFRRSTDELRSTVEGEFYRMDLPKPPPPPEEAPVPSSAPHPVTPLGEGAAEQKTGESAQNRLGSEGAPAETPAAPRAAATPQPHAAPDEPPSSTPPREGGTA